ncbi:hypothetical protein GCM10010168_37550 [Actinoplanes ianthinogenes]|uniref:Uncharacterized protein n=1 Tax=Actinoplanes ianthinogenes TaxID=122358 RepID=A0ABM7M563_9ACTN|nr:hypothetical protein Aiant_73800 [Actinoplanes ianthinogenes]GGR16077.1 hypothetical protein GCM10010168_37550 [Actinoplanes ianthinogenes]
MAVSTPEPTLNIGSLADPVGRRPQARTVPGPRCADPRPPPAPRAPGAVPWGGGLVRRDTCPDRSVAAGIVVFRAPSLVWIIAEYCCVTFFGLAHSGPDRWGL